ncbi:MAG: S41 family peptidase [Candidatus Palauibacterales bacterium]|nr:S41 family peptidase [Candidatus Palauibacterales bacterium]MDP2582850.1 S41 family peptidase [Candidatus Palauibacterales bacterium]
MKLNRSWIPALVVALVALTSGGWLLQRGVQDQGGAMFEARLLQQVHRIVDERYVDSIGSGKLYKMAIDGMLEELHDPYSVLLDSADWSDLQLSTTGNYGGLGIRIDKQGDWITVVDVLPDTPAEQEGLQTGDRILTVEGASAQGWTTTKAVNTLRGPEGSSVQITVGRVGVDRPLSFSIERRQVHVVSVQSFMLRDHVGYVRLDQFSREARQELQTAIDSLKSQGATRLVFDLRYNPGGLLEEGVAVADLFLPNGAPVVSTRGRVASENETYDASEPDKYPGLPVVVLVNGYTASAAEIVSGALQDHDRALLVGTTTFGKGLVQSLYNLPGDNHLKLTTGRWYTPSGRDIQKPHGQQAEANTLQASAVSMTGEPVRVEADTANRKTYHTDDGRVVYGGGGITPDLLIATDTLTSREQLLRSSLAKEGVTVSIAAFQFGVKWAKAHPDLPGDFQVTPAMRAAFLEALSEKAGSPVDRKLFDDSKPYVDWLLGYQVANAAFGEVAQLQRQFTLDDQLQRSVELLAQASSPKQLFALAEQQKSHAEGPATTPTSGR